MTTEQKPAEVVANAVHSEQEASLFYRMLSEMVSEDDVADKLLELAKDEESHAKALADLHVSLAGHGVPAAGSAQPEGAPDLFDVKSNSLHDVLAFALRNEVEAVTLYEAEANRATTADARKIWLWLADAERGHAAYLRLQLERIGEG